MQHFIATSLYHLASQLSVHEDQVILLLARVRIQLQDDPLNLQRSEPTGFSEEEKGSLRARRASETAEQREDRLRKRRIRDRAKWTAKTAEERMAALQQRRERWTTETEEQREARL